MIAISILTQLYPFVKHNFALFCFLANANKKQMLNIAIMQKSF